jgi:hypothetical protein
MNRSKDLKKCSQKYKYVLLNINVINKKETKNDFFIFIKSIKKNFITSDIFISFINEKTKEIYTVDEKLTIIKVL